MNRPLTGVVALALVGAGVLAAAPATADADDTRERPIQVVTITPKVRLLSTTDTRVACLTMSRSGEYTVEKVDVVFRYKVARHRWATVWQAEDGFQFVLIPVPQNQPWACIPLKARVSVPDAWTQD